jgi:hypothetical protein
LHVKLYEWRFKLNKQFLEWNRLISIFASIFCLSAFILHEIGSNYLKHWKDDTHCRTKVSMIAEIVSYALYLMHCILCIILCIVSYALYPMHCILCIVSYALYHMHCILCIVSYKLYPMHCILCIVMVIIYISTIQRVWTNFETRWHRQTDRQSNHSDILAYK